MTAESPSIPTLGSYVTGSAILIVGIVIPLVIMVRGQASEGLISLTKASDSSHVV